MENKIVEYRKQKNITQQDMADLLGISNVTLHHYETGKRNIPYDIAKQIAEILNKRVDEIFLPEKFSIR